MNLSALRRSVEELLGGTPSDVPLPAWGRLEELVARQAAPGFQQRAIARCPAYRLVLDQGCPDRVGDHWGLLLGAMGGTQQVIGTDRVTTHPLDGALRALLLNPSVTVQPVPNDVATVLAIQSAAAGRVPYICVRLGANLRSADAVVRRLGAAGKQNNLRFYTQRRGGVVVGSSASRVFKAGKALGPPGSAGSASSLGAIEASQHMLSDFLAYCESWTDERSGRPMPRSPELQVFRDVPTGSEHARVREPLTVMLVGAGALGQAYLEACLADPAARAELAFGTIILVDPDEAETSNLSRQSLLEGPHQIGRPKAVIIAETFARLWGAGPGLPRIVPVVERVAAEHFERFSPQVVGLFTDNLRSRSLAYQAARRWSSGIAILAGTAFTVGQVRGVCIGERGIDREPGVVCFDCGPEQLAKRAAQESEEPAARQSCGREITPSNVLTNALVGSAAVRITLEYRLRRRVEPVQRYVNWRLAERITTGPALPRCTCGTGSASTPARAGTQECHGS